MDSLLLFAFFLLHLHIFSFFGKAFSSESSFLILSFLSSSFFFLELLDPFFFQSSKISLVFFCGSSNKNFILPEQYVNFTTTIGIEPQNQCHHYPYPPHKYVNIFDRLYPLWFCHPHSILEYEHFLYSKQLIVPKSLISTQNRLFEGLITLICVDVDESDCWFFHLET